jgi:hypothetical protein
MSQTSTLTVVFTAALALGSLSPAPASAFGARGGSVGARPIGGIQPAATSNSGNFAAQIAGLRAGPRPPRIPPLHPASAGTVVGGAPRWPAMTG